MQREWRLKTRESNLPSFFDEYPDVVGRLLFSRGISTPKQLEEFLRPDCIRDLQDPFLMLGMKKAITRIIGAIKSQEQITLFGDYDADGVSGTAILETALREAGANIKSVYLPDRHKEGYGLNLEAIKQIAQEGSRLIITVDCGITDVEEVAMANKLGLEVIICDHHHVWPQLPQAVAIVNPHQPKDKYPFKDLAGAGVAFKVAHALLQTLEKPNLINWLKWQLDLVALATVGDCVSLTGENRMLVKYGLMVMAQTRRLGLRELLRVCGLQPVCNQQELTCNLDAFTLGYLLAPRINAAGRMDHANTAYELVMTESTNEAKWLAERLNDKNKERQAETEKLTRKAETMLRGKTEPFIFEGGAEFSLGLAGLVAGKLAERHFKPALIYGEDGELIKGSVREHGGYNIIELFKKTEDLFVEYGGHPAAAGFALKKERLKEFRQRFAQAVQEQSKKLPPLVLEIDDELELITNNELNQLWTHLIQFEPFGVDNPEPIFLSQGLKIVNMRVVGNGSSHLKLELSGQEEKDIFQTIGFGLGARIDELKIGQKIDVVFKILIDEWNGTKRLNLKLVDFKTKK